MTGQKPRPVRPQADRRPSTDAPRWFFASACGFLLALAGTPAYAAVPIAAEEPRDAYEQVYLTPAQALQLAVPGADRFVVHTYAPTAEARSRAEKRLGRRLDDGPWTFHEGQRQGATVGWALILDEKGKYHPITFVVGLAPGGAVTEVAVMVYRERRGDAVRRRRFLGQFEGKTSADALMVNRDIVHLSGATVSSWSIAAGVKKAAVVFDEIVRPQADARRATRP